MSWWVWENDTKVDVAVWFASLNVERKQEVERREMEGNPKHTHGFNKPNSQFL